MSNKYYLLTYLPIFNHADDVVRWQLFLSSRRGFASLQSALSNNNNNNISEFI